MKTVSVVGLGYVGLPTAILLAESGWTVFGYDIDQKKISELAQGRAPLEEKELEVRLHDVTRANRLSVSSFLHSASYYIIAVPTPCTQEKKIDLSFVEAAATEIAKVLKKGDVIIIESTIAVGSTKKIATLLEEISGLQKGVDFYVAYCPERVLPGNAFQELIYNSRTIGGINDLSARKAELLYATFVQGELFLSNDMTAELVKLVENSSRDVSLAFSNQVAALARACKLDPFNVIELANKHPRVSILQPGCGVGGHCLPIDPWFLIETFPAQTTLLHEARRINDERPYEVYQEIGRAISLKNKNKKNIRVLLLGLTYKPESDDLRASPALEVALLSRAYSAQCEIKVWEPHLTLEQIASYGLISKDEKDAIHSFDIIVTLVNHAAFSSIPAMIDNDALIVDTCGLFYKKSGVKTFRAAQAAFEDSREASLKGIQQASTPKSYN